MVFTRSYHRLTALVLSGECWHVVHEQRCVSRACKQPCTLVPPTRVHLSPFPALLLDKTSQADRPPCTLVQQQPALPSTHSWQTRNGTAQPRRQHKQVYSLLALSSPTVVFSLHIHYTLSLALLRFHCSRPPTQPLPIYCIL